MTGRVLRKSFFERYTPVVARELLGKFLVRKKGKETRAFMITEVEAYAGRNDMSSHARMGPTKRNRVMFEAPGHWYVYFIYGMYHCLNIVTEKEGMAGAVLIRGVAALKKGEPPATSEARHGRRFRREGLISGPGKLCKLLNIKLSHYGKPAAKTSGLWIEDQGVRVKNNELRIKDEVWKIKRTPRINVGGTDKFKKRLWRFILQPK